MQIFCIYANKTKKFEKYLFFTQASAKNMKNMLESAKRKKSNQLFNNTQKQTTLLTFIDAEASEKKQQIWHKNYGITTL